VRASKVASTTENLRRREAAEYLNVSESTLAHWAWLGTGPRFSRTGEKRGVVTYRLDDLRAWLESRSIQPPQERR
jgi:predicted DNA-binding transcriptional regulator AlpA